MTDFEPPLRLTLDGEALVSNWRYLKGQGQAGCGAAVKANGYGLGAVDVVRRLRDAGCRDFFVAHWGEAAAISHLVAPDCISVLNGITAADIPHIRQIGAIPVLNTPQQIALWRAAGGGRCHVMLDSGINRLGIGAEQFAAPLFEGLDIDILLSHLASADEDSAQNNAQLRLFRQQTKLVKAKRLSLANSAGIMLSRDFHFDLTRPGLALYGGVPRTEMAPQIKPVVSLSSRILQVRTLTAGESVGYNATYTCTAPTRVATISLGYADGYLRSFAGKGNLRAHGVTVPIIGRVSMDLVTADVTALVDIKEGDWIDVAYDLPHMSGLTGLSQYELLTNLGHRFGRIWK
ncbi:alanine racemase [Sphingorhabdus contaminans]|uniref:alanine racemase n=1 Tax=Sphingorhabdus contaminans TaxID=1343899 RepID=UPI003D2AE51E